MKNEEYAKIVSKNLKRLAFVADKTQADISRELRIPKASISAWMNGTRVPKIETIDLLCGYFGVERDDIMEPEKKIAPRPNRIPVLGYVAAGIPIDAIEDVLDWEEITPAMATTGKYFGLRIKGRSMEPRMFEGDVVIVRSQQDAESGDVVIVQVNGDSATCKRLVKHAHGISLVSFNPAFDHMTFSDDDIKSLPVTIIGRVVENRQKY